MTRVDKTKRFTEVFLFLLLNCAFHGAHCQLVVSPAGHTVVNAEAGRNVTLAVSFIGAPDPVVVWFMKDVPLLTWSVGLSAPNIAENERKMLRLEPSGSLTFVNVTLNYSSDYTFEVTKSGLKQTSTTFTLNVYEIIQNVSLRSVPDLAIEGTERFSLEYSMSQGVVQQQTWLFNRMEIQNNSHYCVKDKSVEILNPTRSDTGQYSVFLSNPLGNVTTHINVTVLYGPENSIIQARPARPFYVSGDSLLLSCSAKGSPKPTAEWIFGGQNISRSGILNLTNVKASQGGNYTCMLLNELTRNQSQISFMLHVYEKPSGNPLCSVQSVNNNVDLQYHCQWSVGTPQARIYFPQLDNSKSGLGNLSLHVNASEDLDGRNVTCLTEHPIENNTCNIAASSPVKFTPTVGTTVSFDKIVVSIHCVSEASPSAVVSWSRGSEAVANGTTHQISSDTMQLQIRDHNVSTFLLQSYTCTCKNPLGGQRREIQLTGPSISDSFSYPNPDGTNLTLTWEVPPYSIVTGFDIQMKGPGLQSKRRYANQTKDNSNAFQTILQKPGSARTAEVFDLDPKLTYRFQVIPEALMTYGEPSAVHRIGPGEGLSGPAIAGIAAGIPCSLLFLLLLALLIYLCFYCHKNRSRLRYPVSRAVEKAIPTQTDSTPNNLLVGGLKAPPDYNRFQKAPSERSVAPPSFVPPPPVRQATTV